MDNCWRENKNKYMLAFLSYLVKNDVFEEIIVNFLPVGHTHNDGDQLIYVVGSAFKDNNALLIEDMHDLIRNKLQNRLLYMEHVISFLNWSEFTESSKFCNNLTGYYVFYKYQSPALDFDGK